MSDEQKPESATRDETATHRNPEPEFDNCWIDKDGSTKAVKVGPITFTLRAITAGEHIEILARSRRDILNPVQKADQDQINLYAKAMGKEVSELTDKEKVIINQMATKVSLGEQFDSNSIALLTVAAALGAYNKIGSEGWSDARPVNEANVRSLKLSIIEKLFSEHQDFFRSGS